MKLERKPQMIWEKENPILEKEQIGFEMGNRKLKIGDGTTAWKDLDYTNITEKFEIGEGSPVKATKGMYYLDTKTEEVYKKTGKTTWTVDTNLKNELPLVRRIFRIAKNEI
jgi:hypothetical protein